MITDNENNQRSLFNIVINLNLFVQDLSWYIRLVLHDDALLADSFIEFFLSKIQAIQKDISSKCSGSSSSESNSGTCVLQTFQPLSTAC
jgi:hypothetical protein